MGWTAVQQYKIVGNSQGGAPASVNRIERVFFQGYLATRARKNSQIDNLREALGNSITIVNLNTGDQDQRIA